MNAHQIASKLLEAEPLDPNAPEVPSEREVERRLDQVVTYVKRPYTIDELSRMTNNGADYIDLNIAVGLWDLIEHDVDWLNDTAGEMIAGNCAALTDIGFTPVGVDGDSVIINVTASIADWVSLGFE